MHELQVTESILAIALRHAAMNNVEKILSIQLRVGELSDLENEWLQKYYDYLSKDTIADGAILKIERTPVVMICDDCAHSFQINIKEMKETLPIEIKSELDRISPKYEVYVVPMLNDGCTGCFIKLPVGVANNVKNPNECIFCPNCHRYL